MAEVELHHRRVPHPRRFRLWCCLIVVGRRFRPEYHIPGRATDISLSQTIDASS